MIVLHKLNGDEFVLNVRFIFFKLFNDFRRFIMRKKDDSLY